MSVAADIRNTQVAIEVAEKSTNLTVRVTQVVIEVAISIGLNVYCVTPSALTLGVPFSGALTASGGTPPYTFAIIAGSLPPGLNLNASTGVISGTPTTIGTYAYTAQVTDSLGATATASCSFMISQGIHIQCPPQNVIIVGVFYSVTIQVVGGTPPLTFAITGGALPPGITLNPLTGVISGTTTTPGVYSYTVTVTDANGATASATCALVVNTPCGAPQ